MGMKTVAIVLSLLGGATLVAQAPKAKAPKAASSSLCKVLDAYLTSAKGRFADMEGAVDVADGDESTYVAKQSVPGAKCIVYHEPAGTGPWVDCEMLVTKDEARAKKVFDDTVKKVEPCIAAGWSRDAGSRLEGRQDYVDWDQGEDLPYVTVANTLSKNGSEHTVLISITVPDE
jgi:hypothetical protein